mgnify:FL=1
MKNGKKTPEKGSSEIIVRPEESSVIVALQESGVDYEEEMKVQRENVLMQLPAVKNLKEYENFVYEYGVDEDGLPKRIRLKNFICQVIYDHPIRALFYNLEDDRLIWDKFPKMDKMKVLEGYNPTHPLCSSIASVPNREFAFSQNCFQCPMNFISSPCKPKQRLFVLLNSETTDGQILKAELATFVITTTSLKWWNGRNGYLNELYAYKSKSLPKGLPYYAVWTEFEKKLVNRFLRREDQNLKIVTEKPVSYYEVHAHIFTENGKPVFASKEEISTAIKIRNEIRQYAEKVKVTDYGGPDPYGENHQTSKDKDEDDLPF